MDDEKAIGERMLPCHRQGIPQGYEGTMIFFNFNFFNVQIINNNKLLNVLSGWLAR